MSVTLHVEPGPSAGCVAMTVLLLILTRLTVTAEQVSEPCNITVHCSVAGDPSSTKTSPLRAANGEGTVERV